MSRFSIEGEPAREEPTTLKVDGGLVYDAIADHTFLTAQTMLLRGMRSTFNRNPSTLDIYVQPLFLPDRDPSLTIVYGTARPPDQELFTLSRNGLQLAQIATVFYHGRHFNDDPESLILPRNELFEFNRVPYIISMQELGQFESEEGVVMSTGGVEMTEARVEHIAALFDQFRKGKVSSGELKEVLKNLGLHSIPFRISQIRHKIDTAPRETYVSGLNPAIVRLRTPEEI